MAVWENPVVEGIPQHLHHFQSIVSHDLYKQWLYYQSVIAVTVKSSKHNIFWWRFLVFLLKNTVKPIYLGHFKISRLLLVLSKN